MKKFLPLLCLLAVCNLKLPAQSSRAPKLVHVTRMPSAQVPADDPPAGLVGLFNNLGSGTDLFNDAYGWEITGPNWGGVGPGQFFALPFTPKSNSHVSQVRVAIEWGENGANQINLSIYADSNGSPGSLLAGPVTVTNLPYYFTCCKLTTANFTPLALSAGTQYWIVANTPASGTGSDFYGLWDVVPQVVPEADTSDGSTWIPRNANTQAAAQVLGTIP
ncbi:MAG: choice-of-anchor R domain-containing protein [Candidatus Sulfotelmatobacter sp.]